MFSHCQTGFWKRSNDQRLIKELIKILIQNNDQKFRKSLDEGAEYATLLNDLSNIFDGLSHDRIKAKLDETKLISWSTGKTVK